MRKKRMVILLLFSLLCLGAIVVNTIYAGKGKNTQKLGLAFVEDDSFLNGKVKQQTVENPGVLYEDVLLPYDVATNRLFLSQHSNEAEWIGMLASGMNQYELVARVDNYWDEKQRAIRENHIFTLWLVGEEDYYELGLVISGMPIINVKTESVTEPEELVYEDDPDKWAFGNEIVYNGKLDVFNPCVGTDYYEIVQTGVSYHHKGASTAGFEKKGYALNLTDSRGEDLDVSLLGMRSDNSWKLNALNTDVSRVREITAAQIWEQFDEAALERNQAGPRLEYVELILDNEYRGLYCLVEPVDAKKLDLDRNDILYKIIEHEPPTSEAIQVSIEKGWRVQYPIRIRYPKVITDYAEAWYPMQDYLNIFYFSSEPDERAESVVCVDNFADMLMFTMVTSASDNTFKNTYLAAKVTGDGQYEMWQIPWDLDYTFGNVYDHADDYKVTFNPDYEVVYVGDTLPKIRQANPERISEAFLKRWKEYREDFLNTDSIIGLFEANKEYLLQTGAIARETARWPEAGVDMNLEEMITYQRNRMEWLDAYFEEWSLKEILEYKEG